MTIPLLFGGLSLFLVVLLLYYIDLLIFLITQNKRFAKDYPKREYLVFLEEKHKKSRHPKKKNYFLFLIILLLLKSQPEKASALIPFLKEDHLMGIKKGSIQN